MPKTPAYSFNIPFFMSHNLIRKSINTNFITPHILTFLDTQGLGLEQTGNHTKKYVTLKKRTISLNIVFALFVFLLASHVIGSDFLRRES